MITEILLRCATQMSGGMPAIEVARMVHALFSAFDAAVQRRGLFKMDTVSLHTDNLL